ncbi:hypothetical protein BTH42_23620 [Burkholderia sp. SRS-W-2-2016]|uniref:hypothetical protein n=1 Tax=Burkholderia sp. SRS-W-2-2016 TaxID=1926878 RepID=UPI00094B3539|nr:hypothetical protein [Burkholderia sp. SRS-W-2-2016]OLL29245.1 hypothetical protein BTH42_23620 [Burkholderia sp. SRS-W-2-2016]
MNMLMHELELARLRAAVRANLDDARVWRWYADLMEDGRVSCTRTRTGWQITVDEHCTVEDESFDRAVRVAAHRWLDIPRAPVALVRRRKRSAKSGAALGARVS